METNQKQENDTQVWLWSPKSDKSHFQWQLIPVTLSFHTGDLQHSVSASVLISFWYVKSLLSTFKEIVMSKQHLCFVQDSVLQMNLTIYMELTVVKITLTNLPPYHLTWENKTKTPVYIEMINDQRSCIKSQIVPVWAWGHFLLWLFRVLCYFKLHWFSLKMLSACLICKLQWGHPGSTCAVRGGRLQSQTHCSEQVRFEPNKFYV